MTIDPRHKPPGQQTTIFLYSPWAVKSSLHTFWVFRLPLCPAQTKSKDGCWFLLCFVLFSEVCWCGWCLLVHFSMVCFIMNSIMPGFYVYDFVFEVNNVKNARWERVTLWWPLWFRENCVVWSTFLKESYTQKKNHTKSSRPHSAHLQMKREARIITRVYGELVPHFCFFLRDLPNQLSISKAQGAEGHCQYEAEAANYYSAGIFLL